MRLGLLALLILPGAAYAGGWQGRVIELGTRQGVEGAAFLGLSSVVLAESGTDGVFELLSPPAAVRVQAAGFAAASALSGSAKIFLTRIDFEATAVRVVGRRDRELSQAELPAEQIRRIAGSGGDALRVVQTLPGVAAVSDFSGQLSVRGGGPGDNQNYLDNIPWPVPYHFGGILTTVPAALLEKVELHSGGFGARYGNADGGIIEAKTRPGQPRLSGAVDINLVTASFLAEGPLALSRTPKSSWVLYGRRSYFDLLLPKILSLDLTALPYFWDLGGTLNLEISPAHRLRLLALATDDSLAYTLKPVDVRDPQFAGDLRYDNRYLTAGLNDELDLGPVQLRNTLYYYSLALDTAFGTGYFLNMQPKVGGLKSEVEWKWGEHSLLLGGGAEFTRQEVGGFVFRRASGQGSGVLSATDAHGITISAEAWQGNAYMQDAWAPAEGLRLTAGLRYDRGIQAVEALGPRLSMEFEPVKRSILRAAWGVYAQNPSPRELSGDFGNPALSSNLTEQAVLGFEQGWRGWVLRWEAYYKSYRQRVVEVPDARIFSNDGEGHAAGSEILFRYDDHSRFFGWLSYAYSRSERKAGPAAPWLPYQYEQPHMLTLLGSLRVTPRLDFSATWRWHSGPLLTPVTGSVPYLNASGGTSYQAVYGEPYSLRLADYSRLDLKAEYKWNYRMWNLSAYVEGINVLNRPNPIGRDYSMDYSSYRDENQLPFLPYLGVTAKF